MQPLKVFIGYDPRETVAYHVLSHSILARASIPISIVPLAISHLDFFNRPRDSLQSTDFSFTRFLVPYLCGYEGHAVYMDCDMLCMADIAELIAHVQGPFSVHCVKHNHDPVERTKFLDQPQSKYEKKNWSSFMVFNNQQCAALTPEYVEHASGLELHQFKWLHSDALIGPLLSRWNYLVGYSGGGNNDVAVAHFTQGGPWFPQYQHCEFARAWRAEFERMCAPLTLQN